jgi:hypothetical protein
MAAPGDRLWLTLSKSMEEASEALRVWGGTSLRVVRGTSWRCHSLVRVLRDAGSTHDEAALVEQEPNALDEHLDGEGLLAIHEVADQNEEDDEDIQVQRRGQEEVIGQEQEGLGPVSASDGANDSGCFGCACRIDSVGLVYDHLGEVGHLYLGTHQCVAGIVIKQSAG